VYGFHKRWAWGLQASKACSPAHPLSRDRPRMATSSVQRCGLRAPAPKPEDIRFTEVPAVWWPMPTPAALDHALESAPSVDPPTIGVFTAARGLALNSAQPATAGGHSHRPRCAKRVLAARMSACRRTITMLPPESWLTLTGESASLSTRDRHVGVRVPKINSDSAAR
jgi:hypothetical protein